MLDINRIDIKVFCSALILLIASSYMFSELAVKHAVVLIFLPPFLMLLVLNHKKHYRILSLIVVFGFLVSLLNRYEPEIPFGLVIDFLILYLLITLILDKNISIEKDMLNNPLIIIFFLWFMLSVVNYFNPLSTNKIAWFYANRSFSIYSLLIILLVLQFFRQAKYLESFLMLWGILAIFGTLWGIKQLFLGVSATEQEWLNAGAKSTHVLWGRLRVFSFFTDASQFAANQAHSALVFGILSISQNKIKKRLLYFIFSAFATYGLIISGSRGPLAIVFIGLLVYVIMINRVSINFWTLIIFTGSISFLKFTFIGQSVYQINRLRTALNFNSDPSLNIRLDRIDQLTNFMTNKPLGYGIGSSGSWAQKFYANGPEILKYTDGLYISIWMQTGIVGLIIKIVLTLILILYLGFLITKISNLNQKNYAIAFYCAYCGFIVSDFTNNLSMQLPSGVLIPITLALIFLISKGKITENKNKLEY